MPFQDIEKYTDFAEELANIAKKIGLKHFRQLSTFERKEDESPVTIADRAIEEAMRQAIEKKFPNDGIFGEETGLTTGSAGLWVLDPIDGTKSFLTGMPLYGTLIAYIINGKAELGVIDMPAINERWIGSHKGTFFNGKPTRTSSCKALKDAKIYTSSPDFFHDPADWLRYDTLSRKAAIRRFGGDCYQYGLLASGHCDIVVEASLMPYDYMALVAVVENAGGIITDWEGEPLTTASGPKVIACSTSELHAEALSYLQANGSR